jgi:hypothetical protein
MNFWLANGELIVPGRYIPCIYRDHRFGDDDFGRFVDIDRPVVAPYFPQCLKTEILGAEFLIGESVGHITGAPDMLIIECLEGRFVTSLDAEEQRPFCIGSIAYEDI